MKKSVVALGVIVALGAVGVGGAWFTGEKAHTEYLRQIELANKQAQALGSSSFKVVYKNKQFERGFFTSQVEDELVISLPEEGETFTIPFSTKLYHGPFPLDQLTKFNFMPVMFSAQGVIGKNETTQPLFDLLKSDKPVQYQATTSYNLSTKGKVELAGGEMTDPHSPQNKISWSNINIGFDVDKDRAGKYDMTLDEVTADLGPSNADGDSQDATAVKSVKTKMKGMKLDASFNPTKWAYIYTGKGSYSTESFEMTSTDYAGKTTSLIEKGLKATSDISLNGDFINLKSESAVDSFVLDGKELGKLTNNSELNHIEANAANALIEAVFTVFKSVRDDKNVNDEVVSEILSSWVEEHGMAIFNNQPQLKLNPVSISDNQGKVSLDLNVALAKDPKFDLMKGSLYKQFTDFAVHIHVDKATAEKILTQLSPEEDKALIKEKIEEQAKQAAAQNIVVNNDKNVTLALVLENGELKLNGQVIPEEQVQGVLFMLIMSAAMQGK